MPSRRLNMLGIKYATAIPGRFCRVQAALDWRYATAKFGSDAVPSPVVDEKYVQMTQRSVDRTTDWARKPNLIRYLLQNGMRLIKFKTTNLFITGMCCIYHARLEYHTG